MIPFNKMLIFFKTEIGLTESSIFEKTRLVFPENSYWKVFSDTGKEVVLQNYQSGEKKILSYDKLGKLFSANTNTIFIVEEKDVPIIIKIG